MKIMTLLLAVMSLSLATTIVANPQTKTVEQVKVQQQDAVTTLVAPNAKIDLNSADANKIATAIKGIGPKRAEAIVAFRQKNGPFQTFADLTHVKGISSRFVEKHLQELQDAFMLGE